MAHVFRLVGLRVSHRKAADATGRGLNKDAADMWGACLEIPMSVKLAVDGSLVPGPVYTGDWGCQLYALWSGQVASPALAFDLVLSAKDNWWQLECVRGKSVNTPETWGDRNVERTLEKASNSHKSM